MVDTRRCSRRCDVATGRILVSLGMVVVSVAQGRAAAQQEPAVLSGVQYLQGSTRRRGAGESAMIALALMKAEVPPTDPVVQACLAKLRQPVQQPAAMSRRWATAPAPTRRPRPRWPWPTRTPWRTAASSRMIATYLIGHQNANGSWDYSEPDAGRHVDLAIRRAGLVGGGERRGRRLALGLGPRRVVVSCRSRARAEAGTTTAMSRDTRETSR